MPKIKSDVRTAFDAVLKQAGFRRVKSYWVLAGDETSVSAHLQRSQFSRQCFFNVSVWINSYGETMPPWHGHLGGRSSDFVEERGREIHALLNDDTPMTLAERTSGLSSYVSELLMPAIGAFRTLSGITKVAPEDLRRMAARHEVYESLGIARETGEPAEPQPMVVVHWMGSVEATEAEVARLRAAARGDADRT